MLPEERALRDELETLAETPRGRELLQLALRGIESDERELVCGRWERDGEAGCLFQHAYWQGVRDGVFHADDPARDWVSSFVGRGDYWNVIRAIEAFDQLGQVGHSDRVGRRLLGTRTVLRQAEWREVVTGLLLDALYGGLGDPLRPPDRVPAG
jgi:hypothetical protein